VCPESVPIGAPNHGHDGPVRGHDHSESDGALGDADARGESRAGFPAAEVVGRAPASLVDFVAPEERQLDMLGRDAALSASTFRVVAPGFHERLRLTS
jgi:hypothetical protein